MRKYLNYNLLLCVLCWLFFCIFHLHSISPLEEIETPEIESSEVIHHVQCFPLANGRYRLSWNSSGSQFRYLVFASSSFYADLNQALKEASFFCYVDRPSAEIALSYPFCWVVAEKEGNYFAPYLIALDSFHSFRKISSHVLKKVAPYLLPWDHPVKPILDEIFSSSRVLLNLKSMEQAGFINPQPRKHTRLIVTRHPALKGYIIKAYLDSQRLSKNKHDYDYWLLRIQGARKIQRLIDQHQLTHLFKVPKKWIYALPEEPASQNDYYRKDFILIEEDMNIYSKKQNEQVWKSDFVNQNLLNRLYFILNTLGLQDCAKVDNIPFSTDKRIAFIDTQTHGQWPVNYKRLIPYLSSEMKSYWIELVK